MKLITFDNPSSNLYHLLQTTDSISIDLSRAKKSLVHFTGKLTKKDEEEKASLESKISKMEEWLLQLSSTKTSVHITGKCKDIAEGDVLTSIGFPAHEESNIKKIGCVVVKSVSHRDHKGVFENPADAVGTFFEAYCELYPMQLDEYNNLTN